jgi:hypothetical protein
MSERLGISVEVADVFKKIRLSEKVAPVIKDIAPIAAVVIGLAMRRAGDRQ